MRIFLLIILEIIPITMWVIAVTCTKNRSNYPNTSLGYKTYKSIINRNTWNYANDFAGKLANTIAPILFIVNALVVILLDIIWPMFIVNIFGYVLLHASVVKALDKRFNDKGKYIN